MSPEASKSVSDNPEVTQMLSHDCRTISKNFKKKYFLDLEIDFYPLCHIYTVTGPTKKSKLLISNASKMFSRCQINMFKMKIKYDTT